MGRVHPRPDGNGLRMRTMWTVAALTAAMLAACNPAPKAPGPEDTVRALYAPYAVEGGQPPNVAAAPGLSPDLKAAIDRGIAYGNLLETPVIDYDPVVNAQDWKIGDVAIEVTDMSADAARIVAKFDNMGTPTEVPYDLRLIDGAWLVNNIGEGSTSLRTRIAEGVRPAGAPSEMEAPVRAVYDTYAAAVAKPVPPLHRWAPLTADLRRRLQAPGAGAAFDFDPVIDGEERELGTVAYEAAGSAVIARFSNAGEPKILVYDLVQENGAWRIADIRSPGQWSLTQKLAEAGVR